MTAQQIRDELTDRQAVALTVFGECRREPLAGWYAVAWVIRNRLLTPKRFGYSFKGVCHRPAQFSCWWPGGGVQNYAAVMAAAKQLIDGPRPATTSALGRALQVADDVIPGQHADLSKGADHYYAPLAMAPPGRVPVWAMNLTPTTVIGGHRFYRLVK